MSAPQPWECPRCHRINAPHTPSCFCQPAQAPEPQKADGAPAEVLEALRRWYERRGTDASRVVPNWPDPIWLRGHYQAPLVFPCGPATTRAMN